MILGVDHLALSATSLASASAALTAAGYAEVFHEPALPNPPEKRALLERYAPSHAVAVHRAAAGPALEVTVHGTGLVQPGSPFRPLFEGGFEDATPRDLDPGEPDWAGLLGPYREGARALTWDALEAPVWATPGPGPPNLSGVLAPTADLERELSFWVEGLCFKPVHREPDWVHLGLRSPVPAWTGQLFLAAVPAPGPVTRLDAAGFPCLALLSSDLERDLERALQAGAREVTPRFGLRVNDKDLELALFRSPGGLICEMIRPARGGVAGD